MEIRQLRYFIAVADTLNFSRAAESVYLSQSALSRQIMDLEKEVGLPLLRRSTRQVELTEAGKALKKSAKELISRWEKMLPEVRNQVAEEAQALSLTIGVDARALSNPERRRNFLSVLYDLRRSYPGLRVLVLETCVAECVHWWLAVASLGIFFFWRGGWAVVFCLVYNLLGNLPFQIIQRYNRPRLRRLAEKRRRT